MTRSWMRSFLGLGPKPTKEAAATRILSHREGVFAGIAVANAAKAIKHDIDRDNGNASLRMGDAYSRTTVIDDMHVHVRVVIEFHPIKRSK